MTNKTNKINKINKTPAPRFELLIGMHVIDDTKYDQYRAEMTPILERHGGFFRYDFRVSEMLAGKADTPFNRVFVLSFPDEGVKDAFFSNEEYQAVRSAHFDQSVHSFEQIAQFSTSS